MGMLQCDIHLCGGHLRSAALLCAPLSLMMQDMLGQLRAECSTLLSQPYCVNNIARMSYTDQTLHCLLIVQVVFEGAAADSTGHRSVVRHLHTFTC